MHFTRREALLLGAGAALLASAPAALARGPRFHLVGVSGASSRTMIRARRRGGAWSEWVAVGGHPDPVWTGPADELQIRGPGTAVPIRLRATARAAAKTQPAPAGAPPMVMRAAWGGDARPPKSPPDYGEVQLAFVHHTVSTNDYAPEDSAAIVLGICRYHQDHNRWNDIGYNFLVDKYGQIFEGRAGGIEQPVVGAQAQGYNSVSTGIACIGDFSTLPNAEAGLEAVARLIGWKLPHHGAPVAGEVTVTSAGGSANKHPSGTSVTLERISGHRDGNKTACPGDSLYRQLPFLRERAAAYAAPISALTLKTAAAKVRHPAPVLLSGLLRFSDGASPAGASIRIQYQASGAAWSEIAATNAGADGAWNASVAALGTGSYRAVFPGDGTHPPLEAAAVAITVIPRVTMKLGSRRAAPSAKVEVTGTIGPSWPSKVALVLEIKRGGKWRPVQRKRINVRGGVFSSFVRPKAAGLYRVSVEAPDSVVRRQLRITSTPAA